MDEKRETWISRRRRAGFDWGELVDAVNALVVTPTDHGEEGHSRPVPESVTVDTAALMADGSYGPRWWQLDYVGDGMWEHAPSGTEPRPLAELLFTIAMVTIRDEAE